MTGKATMPTTIVRRLPARIMRRRPNRSEPIADTATTPASTIPPITPIPNIVGNGTFSTAVA